MAQEHNDEVDLVYVIKKIKETIKGWIVLLFKAIDYAIKYWWVILALVVVGFGLGFYQMKDTAKPNKAKVIVRVNYELQNYILNSVELYNAKAKMNDSVHLTRIGFSRWNPEVKEIIIEPIIDFKDIVEEYDVNERSLGELLKSVNFEGEDMPLSDLFIPKYNYFELDFSLTGNGTEEDIKKLLETWNQDQNLSVYKQEARKNLEVVVNHNIKSIKLIDTILQSYVGLGANIPATAQIEKDLDLNRLMESKLVIQKQNQKLKNELALSGDIIVALHDIHTRQGEGRLLNKKHIVYPIFFVFIFFLLSYMRYAYFYLRAVARENEV